jgi:hypothetical protein
MIDPQIHNGQRSMLGQHHGLQKLTDTLDALRKGQAAQAQRDTQIQAHLATQATRSTRLLGAAWVLAVLTLGLCGVVGWQATHPPDRVEAQALGALDATLMATWSTLPKGTQEAVAATYARLRLVPPGQRR